MSKLLSKVKLHAPPVALVVAVLAWLFGGKVSGTTLQDIGQVVTLVLGGAALPSVTSAASNAATAAKAKVAAKVAAK